MSLSQIRRCPLCDSNAIGITFPYLTRFNSTVFSYMKCGGCYSVFVDPVPDDQTFARMYAKSEYHDCYYSGSEDGAYATSVELLKRYAPAGAFVLDYGCGSGTLLKVLRTQGYEPYGIEFDSTVASSAGASSNCVVMCTDDFESLSSKPDFDVVHFGDVLEHLPDPASTLKECLGNLRPGGVLFVEGPLEINASPVYWSARLFGAIKRLMRPQFIPGDAPTHLFRTGEMQQKNFFLRVEPRLRLKHWQIYETGWPYTNGGILKRAISTLASAIGGRKILRTTFGNRFRAVYVLETSPHCRDEPSIEA